MDSIDEVVPQATDDDEETATSLAQLLDEDWRDVDEHYPYVPEPW